MPSDIELNLKITQEGDFKAIEKGLDDFSDSAKAAQENLRKQVEETRKGIKQTKTDLKSFRGELESTEKSQNALWNGAKLAITGALIAGAIAMKNFIKESIKAADAAGLLPDAFERDAAATKRLQEQFGAFLGTEGQRMVSWFADAKEGAADHYEALNMLNMAEEQGLITAGEHNKILHDAKMGFIDVGDAANQYADDLDIVTSKQRNLNQEMKELKWMVGTDFVGAAENFEAKMYDLQTQEQQLITDINELGNSWRANTKRGRDELDLLNGKLQDVQGQLKKTATSHAESTAKMVFGLMEAQFAADGLNEAEKEALDDFALRTGLVTQEELDLIEVTTRLAKETSEKGGNMIEAWDAIYQSVLNPQTAASGLLGTLKNLTSKQWNIYINLITTGSLPSVTKSGAAGTTAGQTQKAGMTSTGEKSYEGRQHGGPLYPGKQYALHEGELVQMGAVGGHATPSKDIINYDLLASKITQNIVGPIEDMWQKMVIALG